MKKKPKQKHKPSKRKPSHPLCRPPSGATDVRRLGENGRFKLDDSGEPGLAFFGIAADAADEMDATVWVASCDCKVHADCPAAKALEKACMIYDAASLVRRPQAKTKV